MTKHIDLVTVAKKLERGKPLARLPLEDLRELEHSQHAELQTPVTRCGRCHTCGTQLREVLDGEEWCPSCNAYRRYRSHGWAAGAAENDDPGCPANPKPVKPNPYAQNETKENETH